MKWNEMSGMRKAGIVFSFLCFVAGFALTILDAIDVVTGMDWLEDLLDCAALLSLGIVCWKKESSFAIGCFVLSGLSLICFFL